MNKRDRLLSKIKKLLALSKSANPQKFARKAPQYIHSLCGVTNKAFGVSCYLQGDGYPIKSHLVFFGQDERSEIASYCFDVLFRQLNTARKAFNTGQSKRLKRSTLISRAEAFCEGWVDGIYQSVREFALNLTEQEKTALANYHQILREQRNFAESKVRSVGDTCERTGDSAMWQGYQQGKKVKLNHGVKGKEQTKLTMKS